MPTIACTCGTTAETTLSNLGETERQTGFVSVWNISNGLTNIWLCPACAAVVEEAWRKIIAITKTDMINMSGFLKSVDRNRQRGGA